MPRNLTVAQLISRGRKRADMENSELLSPAEWQENLSQVFGELYEQVADSGMRYYEAEDSFSSDGGATYTLPSDHLSTIGVDSDMGNGRKQSLDESMMQERNRFLGATGSKAQFFALIGQKVVLYPTPPSGQTYYHTYIPQPPDLSEVPTDEVVDCITPSGEAFVVYGISALAKHKEESDTKEDNINKAQALNRLKDWAMQRSLITPRRPMTDDDEFGYIDQGEYYRHRRY